MEPPTPTSTGATHLSPTKDSIDAVPDAFVTTRTLFNRMKDPLSGLDATYEGLQGQSMQVAHLAGDVGAKSEIIELCQQIQDQDRRHKEAIDEIQNILDDLFKNQAIEQMRKQVEEELAAQIDEVVKEQVAACLRTHIPPELQDEVVESNEELEKVRIALHNSESRRANADLRSNKPDALLHTIYMSDGKVSPAFPNDLKSLFGLDGETCNTLMLHYELPNPTESRDRNLNRIMQFCGVKYQLVRPNA